MPVKSLKLPKKRNEYENSKSIGSRMVNPKILLRPPRVLFILFLKAIVGLIPKDHKLVLFGAWFGQKYADNTMYMYEYCLKKKDVSATWFTKNRAVYNYLRERKMPVVFSGTAKGLFTQMRANMLVSTVDYGDFNTYLLSGCTLLDLGHGYAIKYNSDKDTETLYQRFFRRLIHINVNHYACAPNPYLVKMADGQIQLPLNRIIYANMARSDVFFDDNLYDNRNERIDRMINHKYTIVYAPTHRAQGKIPVEINKILDLGKIQELCEKHNAVFIVKKHFYHRNEKTDLTSYNNIFDISSMDVETQSLLSKTDLLISDYSAIYIDFLATDRPIILYPYDYEYFSSQIRELFLKLEDNHVGYKPQTPEALNHYIEVVLKEKKDDAHRDGREELRKRYYNPAQELGNSRQYLYKKMLELLR
ncbi:MAG: CDP-glycerol glycerophosphotransferase family protein [Lachnospiraceae bacterium]|nr:CDP-glycerol glycerophosphotransferase family protein [Lachnospiraceae bacterium]